MATEAGWAQDRDLAPGGGGLGLLASWCDHLWEMDALPMVTGRLEAQPDSSLSQVVEVRRPCGWLGCGYVSVACDDRPTPWARISCKATPTGALVRAPAGSAVTGALVRSGNVEIRTVKTRLSPAALAHLLAGLVCWALADLLIVRESRKVLCDASSGRPAGALVVVGLAATFASTRPRIVDKVAIALVAYCCLRALAGGNDGDEAEYDPSRGFFVPAASRPKSAIPGLISLAVRLAALVALATAAARPYVGLATVALVVFGPLLWRHAHAPPSRSRRPATRADARHTRASLAQLHAHLLTSAGSRDVARLAQHPHYARRRDAELRHFLETGHALHQNCLYRLDDRDNDGQRGLS